MDLAVTFSIPGVPSLTCSTYNILGIGRGKKEKVSNKNKQMYIFLITYHWESFNHNLKLGTHSKDSLHFYLHILMCFLMSLCLFLWITTKSHFCLWKWTDGEVLLQAHHMTCCIHWGQRKWAGRKLLQGLETPSDTFSDHCHNSLHPWEATVIESLSSTYKRHVHVQHLT